MQNIGLFSMRQILSDRPPLSLPALRLSRVTLREHNLSRSPQVWHFETQQPGVAPPSPTLTPTHTSTHPPASGISKSNQRAPPPPSHVPSNTVNFLAALQVNEQRLISVQTPLTSPTPPNDGEDPLAAAFFSLFCSFSGVHPPPYLSFYGVCRRR